MYTQFFGLNEKPFSISPDPRYLYMSRRHADALAHLIYGVSESGGFIQLTGEVGTGKTTLIRSLLEQLPERTEIALILNPQLSAPEFLQAICAELGIDVDAAATPKEAIDRLNAYLLDAHADGRRVVLIVDEAQTLSAELLEQVRLLTNLETTERKLLQIILIGQPELRDLLDKPEMRQVAQRVTGRYHLEPLSRHEATRYIRHRMQVAGTQAEVFTDAAIRQIYRSSGGIPRLINVVADRVLLAAYTRERHRVDAKLVREAAAEIFGHRLRRPWWPWAAAAGCIVLFGAGTTNLWLTGAGDGAGRGPPGGDAGSSAGVSEPRDATRIAAADAADATEAADPAEAAATAEAADDAPDASGERAAARGPGTADLAALLTDAGTATDTTTALEALFGLWEADYEPDAEAPCEQARAAALECLSASDGSLAELRRLDRPAILSLVDGAGTEHQLVIRTLGPTDAELAIGDTAHRVDVADLTHHWYGEYLLLWKPVFGTAENLMPGMRDDAVPWLRRGLAELLGTTVESSEPALYDDALASQVREYQRESRLTVDGIVGVRTQIALSSDLGRRGIPRLVEEH